MVRCLDCQNLVRAYFPTTTKGALFNEKWRCKVTGQVFEESRLVEIERQCLKSKKYSYMR